MKRKKTARKPAKVLRKKHRQPQDPIAEVVEVPKELSQDEIQQIRDDAQRLFDLEMFGEIEPTKSQLGLTLIRERMKYAK